MALSNSGLASQDLLKKLHCKVAKSLLDKIESGEATAADYQAAIKFLKDNGIEALPTPNNPLGKLANELPFPADQEEEDE